MGLNRIEVSIRCTNKSYVWTYHISTISELQAKLTKQV